MLEGCPKPESAWIACCFIGSNPRAAFTRNCNKKCKTITHLVLPIYGDQGKQIKLEDGGIRIQVLFKKQILPVVWLRTPVGFIRSSEFFQRGGEWYRSICYHAKAEKRFPNTERWEWTATPSGRWLR